MNTKALTQRIPISAMVLVEADILQTIYELIFVPVLGVLQRTGSTTIRLNAEEDPLREALRSGRVQYEAGVFSGKFSAAISRAIRAFGGRFDSRSSEYRAPVERVPSWVSAESGVARIRSKDVHEALLRSLDRIEQNVDEALSTKTFNVSVAMGTATKGFRKVAEALEIPGELNAFSQKKLTENYIETTRLAIKKFTKEATLDLRKAVEANALQGYRFSSLHKSIEHRYSVSKNKAKFLARQETSLFVSKFRREQFSEAGVARYVWSTSHDERVRGRHRLLDGKEFFYSDPPIVDATTGRKGNPGEDFNCRCIDIPIIDKLPKARAA